MHALTQLGTITRAAYCFLRLELCCASAFLRKEEKTVLTWKIANNLDERNGELHIGGVGTLRLAREYGTPLYVYNADRILENFRGIRDAMLKHADREVRIYYAVKANTALAILKLLSSEGAYADVVSPFEAKAAIDAGFDKSKIMFTGTSVSNRDLESLVELGVMINIDSFSQMRRLAKMGKFRISIRWNPGEGVGHHEHVITAGKLVKFGIPEEKIVDAFREAVSIGLEPVGLHQHIGSGWLDEEVDIFLTTVEKTLAVARDATVAIGKELEFVDFGGGMGIPYFTTDLVFPLDKYAGGICSDVKESGLDFKAIAIEPGRYIVGDAGVLLTEINTVEEKGVPLVGVDAGFNTLVRPAMYNAIHQMVICNKADRKPQREYMIAGNLCETGDVFHNINEPRKIPVPEEGDILAIIDAGAYGFSMASEYNMRTLPAEVLIENGVPRIIRERRTYEDAMRGQKE